MLYLTLHVDHEWKYKKKRNIKYNIYPSISLYPLSKITQPIIYYIKYQDESAYIYNQTYNLIGNGIIDLNSNNIISIQIYEGSRGNITINILTYTFRFVIYGFGLPIISIYKGKCTTEILQKELLVSNENLM